MTQPTLLKLAKQGNAYAIATLLHNSLQAKGITVSKAALKDGCFYIMFESPQVPNQEYLVNFIHKAMIRLGAQSINSVKLYGKQSGQKLKAWSQKVELTLTNQTLQKTTTLASKTLSVDRETGSKIFGQNFTQTQLVNPPAKLPVVITSNQSYKENILLRHRNTIQKSRLSISSKHTPSKNNLISLILLFLFISIGSFLATFLITSYFFVFPTYLFDLTFFQQNIQREPQQIVPSILRSQSIYYSENGKFFNHNQANDYIKLTTLINTPSQTQRYTYSTHATEKVALIYGIAKNPVVPSVGAIRSYIGAVFVLPDSNSVKGRSTITIICQSNIVGINQPTAPTYQNGVVACGAGTIPMH